MDGGPGAGADGSYAPFPTDINSFFGGSFFSQLDVEGQENLMTMLPRVNTMNDHTLLAELDKLSTSTDEHALSETHSGFGEEQRDSSLVHFIRTMAQINDELNE